MTRRGGGKEKGAIPSYGISGRINRPSGHRHPCRVTPFFPRPLRLNPPLSLFLPLFLFLFFSFSPQYTCTVYRDPYNSVFIPVFSVPGHGIDIAHHDARVYELSFAPSLQPSGPRIAFEHASIIPANYCILYTHAVQSFLGSYPMRE